MARKLVSSEGIRVIQPGEFGSREARGNGTGILNKSMVKEIKVIVEKHMGVNGGVNGETPKPAKSE